jgi:hypothetical protein
VGDTTTSTTQIGNIYAFGTRIIIGNGTRSVDAITAVGQHIDVNPTTGTGPTSISNVTIVGSNLIVGRGSNAAIFGLNSDIVSGSAVTNYSGQVLLVNSGFKAGLRPDGAFVMTGTEAFKAGTAAWISTSDRRLKANITPANIVMCEDLVRNLELKRYTWKDNVPGKDRTQLGWIAQEVKEYLPKSVVECDWMGLVDCNTLDASQITMCVYGALKRCITRIDELESKISILTA